MDELDLGMERTPKYVKLLRKVANRQTTEIVIDLNDLKQVSSTPLLDSEFESQCVRD